MTPPIIRQLELARRHIEAEGDAGLRKNLALAAGVLMGAGYPGSAAAVLMTIDTMWPGHDLVIVGWRASDEEPG